MREWHGVSRRFHRPGGGTVRRLPFHTYSMKQAIQEGFILDVLEHYTPVESYYRLAKTVEENPEYDVRKAVCGRPQMGKKGF